MTDDLSAALRAAEQRVRELEAKVRHLEDRLDRAERWLYKIWVEIEQKFFGGDLARSSQPPHIRAGEERAAVHKLAGGLKRANSGGPSAVA